MSEQSELLLDAPESPETHEERPQVMGFEFLVREPQGERWVQLQGHGGTLGAGYLYLMHDPQWTDLVHAKLLLDARRMLRTEGLREYRDVDDYRERIVPIEVLEVLDVRGPA